MANLELYYMAPSPPCRAVMLFMKTIGVEPTLKTVNVMEGEHMTEEFLELNPQHSVPLLVDEDVPISESRAILMHLADNYTEEESLYPKDPKQRAIVNQRLFFDMGTLAAYFYNCYVYPVIWHGQGIREEYSEKLDEAFRILNAYLDGKEWVAGEQMTIADFSTVATVSTAEGVGFDLSPYPNVTEWLQRCKDTMEGYEEFNQGPLDQFVEFYNNKLNQTQE